MTANGWLQIAFFLLVILALTKPLGIYLHRVFEGEQRPFPRTLGALERFLLRLCGIKQPAAQNWKQYTAALLAFSVLGVLVTYFIQRLQHVLPLNPEKLGAPAEPLAFNTAVSFTTNTNWQAYAGETTMSYLTQMAGLAWHNFTSAAAGLGVALALARGLTRKPSEKDDQGVGNFWVDVLRSIVYVLLPISVLFTLLLVSQGVVQTFAPYLHLKTLEGATQVIPLGPVASQEVIKELGTNGGGFFNANSAHPFENPTPFTNFVEMVLLLCHPRGADLHLRPHGREPEARLGSAGGHERVVRRRDHDGLCLGIPSQRRAVGLSAGARAWQHGRQGGQVRRGEFGPVGDHHLGHLVRCRQFHARQLQSPRRPGPPGQHRARRGGVRRRGRGPLRHPHVRAAVGLHRGPHGRPYARVPGQEDRRPRDEAGHALHPHLPAHHPGLLGVGFGRAATEPRRSTTRDRTGYPRFCMPIPAGQATTARPSPA